MSNLGRSVFFLSLALIGGRDPAFAQVRTLNIWIYDYAGLSERTVRQLSSSIERIVSERLPVRVMVCDTGHKHFCENPNGKWESLEIRILPGKTQRSQIRDRALLGEAFVGPRTGTYASVFLQPVQEQAAAAGVPWMVVLAYAAAHEAGHLLGSSHTPRGLMKAHWDRQDYQAMNQNAIH
ncbi:MAG: hypothetical protein M3Y57_03240 [Acidobacteriota bacterium]|nr:hypothetical protein [Acidobacteriota bacterium]